jgi:release factor glutamine methyltransferase
MSDIAETLKQATQILRVNEIADPRREAGLLLSLALGKNQTFLIAHPEYKLTIPEQKLFAEYLKRRAGREPYQYIAGRQEFYGLDFIVTPDVLIPRPETEMIVEMSLAILKDIAKPLFCEMGVGSGCISISILHHLKSAEADGVDCSPMALEVAEKNAIRHNVADRLTLAISNALDVFESAPHFDLIVSNPPYVPVEDFESLQAEVRDYEPAIALTDNSDGLSLIKKLIADSPQYLKPNGYLLIEIGFQQAQAVGRMVSFDTWRSFEILPDLQGIPRMVKLQKI